MRKCVLILLEIFPSLLYLRQSIRQTAYRICYARTNVFVTVIAIIGKSIKHVFIQRLLAAQRPARVFVDNE